MSIKELLASSQGSRKSNANIALAVEISNSANTKAVSELVDLLTCNDKNLQSDAVKTLYETGYRNPELIAPHHAVFIGLLSHRNNRMVWGAMAALTTIALIEHRNLFESIDRIMEAVRKGSVITIDCGVDILAKLNGFDQYHNTIDPLLMEELLRCPIKQLPTYAEKALEHMGDRDPEGYRNIISSRLEECEKESQVKKLQRLLKKTC